MLAFPAAFASSTYDWVGGSSTDWGNNLNWSPTTVPTATDTARFNAATYVNQPSMIAAATVGQVLITSASGAVTIGGTNALTINAAGVGVGAGGGIDASGAIALVTVTAPVTMGAAQSWSTGTGGLTVNGIVSGGFALTKDGTGTLSLGGANTYTGGTSLNSGTISLGSSSTGTVTNGPLGTGTLTLNAGTLAIPGGITNANAMFAPAATTSSIVVCSTGGSAAVTINGALTGTGTVNISSLTSGGSVFICSFKTLLTSFTGTAGFNTSQADFFPDVAGLNGSAIKFVVNGSNPGTTTTNSSYLFNTTSTANTVQLGELTGGGVVGANNNNGNVCTWQVGALNTSTTFSGIFRDSLAAFGTGAAALNKVGTGTFTLSGVSTCTGNSTVTSGILNVTGTMTGGQLAVGKTSGLAGAVNLVPGGVMSLSAADDDTNSAYGLGDGSYGALNMSGGTMTLARFQFGGFGNGVINGTGVGVISGGTVNSNVSFLILSRTGSSTGSLTLAGGTLNHINAAQPFIVGLGGTAAGAAHAELNLAGGLINNTGQPLAFGLSGFNFSGGRSVVNVDAGTLMTNSFTYFSGTSSLNLNGGTLRATASGTFIPSVNPQVYVNGAFGAFSGGAVFDTNANTAVVAANLLIPPGSGVTSVAVATQGAGYIGAPYVLISGTGTGATAIANMVSDGGANGTLKVGSITVTNPGINYTGTPTYTFTGGGFTTAATAGAVGIGANTSGGLIKNGAGTLVLNGVSTYTGGTQVNAGGLGGIGTLASSVTLNGAATLNPGDSATPGRLTLANATPLVLNTTSQLVFRLNGAAAVSEAAVTDTVVANNDSLNTTAGTVNMNGATINLTGVLTPGFYRLIVGNSFTGTPFKVVAAAGTSATLIQNTASIDVQIATSGTFTWTGGGTDANWMTTGNWTPSVPSGNANEALIFPSGAAQQTNVNNFTNGTTFGSITYNGSAATTYSTTALDSTHGNITLTGAGTALQSAVTVASINSLNVNLAFSAASTISAAALNTLNIGLVTSTLANNGATLTLVSTGTGALVLNSSITGVGSLVLPGTGTVTLAGTNTYSGGLTLAAGTLNANSATAFGATAGTIQINGGTLNNTSAGAIVNANNNPQIWNGDFTFTGTQALNLGTGAVALSSLRSVTVGGSGTTGVLEADGAISGSFGLTKLGTGTLVIAGANVYSGPTIISAGTLQIGSGGTSGQLGTNLNVANVGTLAFNRSDTALSQAHVIIGAGGVSQIGSGTTTLTGASTYSGTTLVTNGILSISAGGSLNGTLNIFTQTGGTLSITNGTVTTGSNASGIFGVGYGAVGTASVIVGNGGILNIGTGGGRTFVGGGNSGGPYGTGIFTINGTGVVNVAAAGAFPNDALYSAGFGGAGTINLDGGTLNTQRSLANGGPSTINFNSGLLKPIVNAISVSVTNIFVKIGGLLVDTNGLSVVLSPALQHDAGLGATADGGLIKNGLGTVTLNGTGTFTGVITLNAGALGIGNGVTVSNPISSPAATNTGIVFTGAGSSASGTLSGDLTGSGTVTFSTTTTSQIVPQCPTAASFTGTLVFDTSNVNFFPAVTSGPLAKWVVNGGGTSTTSGGFLFTNAAGGSTITLGELSGTGRVGAAFQSTTIWSIGTLNSNTTFSGMFMNNYLGNGSGTPTLLKVGSGTLTLSGVSTGASGMSVSAGILTLTGANTFTGATVPKGGTLNVNHQLALQNSALTMNASDSGSVSFGVFAVTLGGLSGGRALSLGIATVSIGNNNVSNSYSGNLSNGNGLIKVGSGTQTLSGVNTYAGTTLISAGTLQLGNVSTLPANLQVMPLGDSITDGTGDNSGTLAGYREGLYNLMSPVAANLLLVGSATTLPGGLPTAQQHHEGHGGYRIDQIANNLDGTDSTAGNNGGFWFPGGGTTGRGVLTPNIVLLHIGTNDILQNFNLATAQSRLDTLVNQITGDRPNALLFVADIVPIFPKGGANDTTVNNYNAMVDAVVAKYAAAPFNAHVTKVDMHTNFPAAGMSGDNVHPNASGYSFMSNQWYNAIQSQLSGTTVSSALPLTSAVTVAASGTLDVNGRSAVIGPLFGAGSVLLGSGGALTVTNATGNDSLFSGVISGAGQLTKQGAGTFTLTNANTYSGATRVSGGDLRGIGSLASPVTVDSALTPASVWPGQALTGATLSANETLTTTGNFSLNSGQFGKLKMCVKSATVTQLLAVTGTTDLTNGTLSISVPANSNFGPVTIVTSTGGFIGGTLPAKLLINGQPNNNNYSVNIVSGTQLQITVTTAVTPITLDSFTAKPECAGVALAWHCVSEFQNVGFNVFRQTVGESEWTRVNSALIAGRITNTDEKSYAYYDWAGAGEYFYKLESIAIDGTDDSDPHVAGPVSVDGLNVAGAADISGLDGITNSLQNETSIIQAATVSAAFAHADSTNRIPPIVRDLSVSHATNAVATERKAMTPNVSSLTTATSSLVAARWFTSGTSLGSSNYIAAKVQYIQPGVLAISQSSMPAGFDIHHVAIQREGRALPILAVQNNTLYVYAPGYTDDYTSTDALFVRKTVAPTSAGSIAKANRFFASNQPVNTDSPASVTASYHDVYFDYSTAYRPYTFTPWFSNKYLTDGTDQLFSVNTPFASSGPATLTVTLWSLTHSPDASPDHALQVAINGTPAGQVATWTGGQKLMQLTFQVPSGVLTAGANKIDLVTPTLQGVDNQVCFVHSLTMNYTRTLDASKPVTLTNSGTTAKLFELNNLPSANVWIVDTRFADRAALVPFESQLQSDNTYRVRFNAVSGGTGQFLVVPLGQENAPTVVSARSVKPISATNYLATGPSRFGSGVQPLLMKHAKEGMRGQFVDQEQLFDYYNYGRYGPAGIQNAVRSVRPRYLLLVGRTTYDYLNYSGANVDPLCPAFLVSTTFWAQTTSDSLFGDLGRGYPEVAVGRLPITTQSELAGAVQHILLNTGAPLSGIRVHAVADQIDPAAGDFPAQAASIAQALPELSWQPNYLGVNYQSPPEVTTALTAAVNSGVDWVIYVGHGNAVGLGNESPRILDTNSVQQWTGNPVFLQSTCTGNWMAKNVSDYKSIAIQALTQPQGGISASIGTSTYMNSEFAVAFMTQLMKVADSGDLRWGDVLMKTQKWASQQGQSYYDDLNRTEQLFGDPAMPVFQKSTSSAKSGTSKLSTAIPGQF